MTLQTWMCKAFLTVPEIPNLLYIYICIYIYIYICRAVLRYTRSGCAAHAELHQTREDVLEPFDIPNMLCMQGRSQIHSVWLYGSCTSFSNYMWRGSSSSFSELVVHARLFSDSSGLKVKLPQNLFNLYVICQQFSTFTCCTCRAILGSIRSVGATLAKLAQTILDVSATPNIPNLL